MARIHDRISHDGRSNDDDWHFTDASMRIGDFYSPLEKNFAWSLKRSTRFIDRSKGSMEIRTIEA